MMTHFGTGDAQSRIDGEETTPWDTQSAQQAEKKQEDVPCLLILFICIAKWGILAGLFAGFVRRAKRCCQCAGIAQSVVRLACGR